MRFHVKNRHAAVLESGSDAAGELSTTTDALDRTLVYQYNAAGFQEKIINPSDNFVYRGGI